MSESVIDKIQQAIARNPSAPAFIYENRIISYRRFHKFLCAAAKLLHARGIKPGDVVGLSMSQSPLYCITMLALARLGAVSVPINPAFAADIKARIVEKFDVHTLVSDLPDAGIEGASLMELQSLTLQGNEDNLDFTEYRPDAQTPFLIAMPLLMSMPPEARKDPKAILYTHGYMIKRMDKTLFEFPADMRLLPPDLNFTMGYICALGTLAMGATVIFPRTALPADLIPAINLYAVSHLFVPAKTAIQIDQLLPDGGIAFPLLNHLRFLEGAPTPELIEKLRTKLSPHLHTSYGSAETAGLTLATPEILAASPVCSGKARPWVQLEIVGKNGRAVKSGKIGEIRARGELLPEGYYRDQESSRKKFRDGWFYTGDFGHISDEGLLFLCHG